MAREKRKEKPKFIKKRKKRPCLFCIEKTTLDYKNINLVRKFVTDRGKIAPRRISGCCALHQRMVAKAVKRARQIGMVPYVLD